MSDFPLTKKVEEEQMYDSDGNENSSSTGDEFSNEVQTETSHSLIQTSPATIPPKGHPSVEVTEEAKQKCPYFAMQKLKGPVSNPPQLTNSTDPTAMSSSSEDEEGNPKRPKGGCPFLPSDRKKNPGLDHAPQTYCTRYQSRYGAYLEEDTLHQKDSKVQKLRQNRKIFDNYPIYLKHTLFHDDDIMLRIRKKDVVERFFAYDKYRERGNRLYNKQRYSEAIFLYERAYSCFRWLELKDQAEDTDAVIRNQDIQGKKSMQSAQEKMKDLTGNKDKKQTGSSLWYTEDYYTQFKTGQCSEERDSPNDLDDKLECKKDNLEEIQLYKKNDGLASERINSLINQRANELSEQEAQRQAILKKKMLQTSQTTQEGEQFNSSQGDSGSDRGISETEEEEEKQQLERISKNNQDDLSDQKSLSVEGFDDGSDRNFSSESEKEIEIEELTQKQKDPSETIIIMDEDEKRRMIAEELFLRRNEKEDQEFRRKYRLFITTFTDDNVKLFDGEGLVDSNDIDLRYSMIVGALLSLGLCYMMMGNFLEALKAFNEAQALHPKGSIPLLRKVQCVVSNSASSFQELLEARSWLEKASQLKEEEKIFNSGNATLVVMNIANHVEFFKEISQSLETRTLEVRQQETERIREMLERVVELSEIEADMLERGITPSDHIDTDNSVITLVPEQMNEIDDNNLEEQLSIIIETKFYAIMEGQMYAAQNENENILKLKRTTNELRKYQETLVLMDFYRKLDFSNSSQNILIKQLSQEYNIEFTQKNIRRLEKLKKETIKEVFNETQHNFTIYKWALDEYFERRKERKLKLEQKAKKQNDSKNLKSKPSKIGSFIRTDLFGKSSLIQFFLLFVLLYFLVLYLRSTTTNPFSFSLFFQN